MSEERFVEIESKIAFQEHTIKQLGDEIYQQQKKIEELSAICQRLETETQRLSASLEQEEGEEPPPPHY